MEGEQLWKRIVSSCYNISKGRSNYIPWQLRQYCDRGPWRIICNIGSLDRKVEKVISNGSWILVGNGQRTLFWESPWIGNQCLKDRFPRLYVVSFQKSKLVFECGFWDGLEWNWSFQWRHPFFEWEK